MDGGARAQIGACTVKQKSEEVCAALQCAASCHCLVEEWQDVNYSNRSQKRRELLLCTVSFAFVAGFFYSR